jgi:hypothetical protein
MPRSRHLSRVKSGHLLLVACRRKQIGYAHLRFSRGPANDRCRHDERDVVLISIGYGRDPHRRDGCRPHQGDPKMRSDATAEDGRNTP